MAKALDFSKLQPLFDKGKDFELTASQYQEKVGKEMPTSTAYLKNSKLSKLAEKNGFKLQVKEKAVIQRTIVFTKK